MKKLFRFAAAGAAALCCVPLVSHGSASFAPRRRLAVPRLLLWAWERPEDLRFIDPEQVGVAFLAATIHLGATAIDLERRMQPLRVASQTKLIAVIRIEAAGDAHLDRQQVQKSLSYLVELGTLPQVVAIQVDFDATVSERVFYRQLLVELRQQLPSDTPISITALASWCIGDPWIADLPIDEAVPMLFRMGVGQREVRSWIGSDRDFPTAVCRDSLGISTDETWKWLPGGRRVYAFSPKPWDRRSLDALNWEIQAWH
jgi:hypothetical protein